MPGSLRKTLVEAGSPAARQAVGSNRRKRMNVNDVIAKLTGGAVALALVSAAHAQAPEPHPMVEWLVPALPTNQPQTAEQAEAGRQQGRELPAPEVLQPTLDPALPSYQPRRDVK